MKILIVDDQPEDAKLLGNALEAAGHTVIKAVDGFEALQLLEREGADAIISDILMPKMHGYRLCHEVRRSDRWRDLPFIIYSAAYTSPKDEKYALGLGADFFLRKPTPDEEIIAALRQVIQKDRKLLPETRISPPETEIMKEYDERLVKNLTQTNQALAQKTEELRRLLEHSPAVIYTLKVEGKRVTPNVVSDNITRMLGFSVEEASTFEWWADHLHPEDRERALASIGDTLKRETLSIEYRIRHKNGAYIWVEDNRRLVRDAQGRPQEIAGVWTDVSARRQAEEVVQQASGNVVAFRRKKMAVEFTILGVSAVVVFFLAQRFELFEAATRWVLRHDASQLDEYVFTTVFVVFGLMIIAFRRWRESAVEIMAHQQAQEALRLLHGELDLRVKQRTVELLQANESLNTEVDERKRMVESLRESDERFHQLAENIIEVFWIRDPVKNQMLYVSPAYVAIWGRTCQSLYDSPETWLEAIHPDDRARIKDATAKKQSIGKYDEIYRMKRPDGKVRWIHDRAFPVRNPAGEVYRIVGTAEDITEHRQLEEQYRQAQKMEAIGTLAGGIAHDFNNILAAINGYTELAKISAKDNTAVREYLDTVLRASKRAVDLVKQILTFSRQQEQKREPMQLEGVVSESLALLRATLPATIEFSISLGSNVPTVLADATQVHQIIMNLGTNAWHAMKDRPGRLDVKLEVFEVDAQLAELQPRLQPGPYAHISISDTGSGMDRATMERIFEPFFTTKVQGEGTGLGLSVVHGIMQSHDGAITVYSQPGEGTIFHLYFPAYVGAVAKVAATAAPFPTGNGKRILFVDDEEVLAQLGQKTLEHLGYKVEMQTNVVAALELVRADPKHFDLVITDQTMPGMTGVDFAKQLLQIRPDLPIILTTGYSATLTSEKVRALGIRILLPKPHTIQSLGTTVHQVLTEKKSS